MRPVLVFGTIHVPACRRATRQVSRHRDRLTPDHSRGSVLWLRLMTGLCRGKHCEENEMKAS